MTKIPNRSIGICAECRREADTEGLSSPGPVSLFDTRAKLCSKHYQRRNRQRKQLARSAKVTSTQRWKIWGQINKGLLAARDHGLIDQTDYLLIHEIIDASTLRPMSYQENKIKRS